MNTSEKLRQALESAKEARTRVDGMLGRTSAAPPSNPFPLFDAREEWLRAITYVKINGLRREDVKLFFETLEETLKQR